MKINVTYLPRIVDLGEDEEFGHMSSEDNCFVVTGLPTKHVLVFWKKVLGIKGCFRRPIKKGARDDGRLRVDWDSEYNDYYEDALLIKEKILEVIKGLVSNAKVRYRQLGSSFSVEDCGLDYDPEDEMLLEGAFTDEEKDCLPRCQRAAILGI